VTSVYSPAALAAAIGDRIPGAVAGTDAQALWLNAAHLIEASRFLHDDPALDFKMLVQLTAVDRIDYFEVVYRLLSLAHNHSAVLKVKAYGREEPGVPSVTGVWKGADLQEREVYDLMGVRFAGHPDMRRILLWDGFQGHPLRKDFLLQRP
jgi:NADH-quinone oxidoreductase subunit C